MSVLSSLESLLTPEATGESLMEVWCPQRTRYYYSEYRGQKGKTRG